MKFDDNINALNEGLWDRTKARAAGAVGTVKGIGNQVAGGVRGAIAGATGNVAGATAAAQQGRQGAVSGQVAKINSYKATAQEKIKKLMRLQLVYKSMKSIKINLHLIIKIIIIRMMTIIIEYF